MSGLMILGLGVWKSSLEVSSSASFSDAAPFCSSASLIMSCLARSLM